MKEYLVSLREKYSNELENLDRNNPLNLFLEQQLKGKVDLIDELVIHISS